MRTSLACLAVLLAVGLYGYVAIGWGSTIWEQGFEAAISDLTTQPSLPVTVGCLVLGTVFLSISITLLDDSKRG